MEPNRPLKPLNEAAWIQLEVQVEVNQQEVVGCTTKEHFFYVYKDFSAKICPEPNLKRTVEPELEAGTIFNHNLLALIHHKKANKFNPNTIH